MLAGHLGSEQRGLFHALQHLMPFTPDPHAKKRCGFPQAVADGRVRLDAVGTDDVCDDRAQRYLAEDGRFTIYILTIRPESIRHELAAEAFRFFILAMENLRPVNRKFSAHVRKMVARSGIDERDLARIDQGLWRVINATSPFRGWIAMSNGRGRCLLKKRLSLRDELVELWSVVRNQRKAM